MAGIWERKRTEGPTCPHWLINPIKDPSTPNELVVQLKQLKPRSVCVKTHHFLKILKQQIMVRTFSTLYQTMMRCYSSLRGWQGMSSLLSSSTTGYSQRQAWLKVAMKYLAPTGLGDVYRMKSRNTLDRMGWWTQDF